MRAAAGRQAVATHVSQPAFSRAGAEPCRHHALRHRSAASPVATRASSSGSASSGDSSELVPDDSFSLAKISFGDILAPLGVGLLVFGFGAFFQLIPGSGVSGVVLISGFPLLLLGFALKYAQLDPVECKTTRAAFEARPAQMTDILKQVREDCTRYRYGDEQHLDEAMTRIFKIGRPEGLPKRQCPKLTGLREEMVDGNYALVLEFMNKKGMSAEQWEHWRPKFGTFFGPGVTAQVDQQSEERVDIVLRTDGSGEGRGGGEKKDVLPPLTPGSKPRAQQ